MEFWKGEGTGNDFVVLVDLADEVSLSEGLVRRLCDRRRGVGADGVIRILAGSGGGALKMEHRNADGSRSLMCGNGARVVGRLATHLGLAGPSFLLETPRGVRGVSVEGGLVSVEMGEARLGAEESHPSGRARAVQVGNSHLVVEVGSLDELGALEGSAQANVEYVETTAAGRLRMRVWELGVGETQSCGSGAVAAAAALGGGGRVEVTVPGGVLEVHERAAGFVLSGPANLVLRGVVGDETLAAWAAQEG